MELSKRLPALIPRLNTKKRLLGKRGKLSFERTWRLYRGWHVQNPSQSPDLVTFHAHADYLAQEELLGNWLSIIRDRCRQSNLSIYRIGVKEAFFFAWGKHKYSALWGMGILISNIFRLSKYVLQLGLNSSALKKSHPFSIRYDAAIFVNCDLALFIVPISSYLSLFERKQDVKRKITFKVNRLTLGFPLPALEMLHSFGCLVLSVAHSLSFWVAFTWAGSSLHYSLEVESIRRDILPLSSILGGLLRGQSCCSRPSSTGWLLHIKEHPYLLLRPLRECL